jgi:hypothetical protein
VNRTLKGMFRTLETGSNAVRARNNIQSRAIIALLLLGLSAAVGRKQPLLSTKKIKLAYTLNIILALNNLIYINTEYTTTTLFYVYLN